MIWLLLAIIAITLVLLLIFLPLPFGKKLTAISVGIGLLFTVYGLILGAQANKITAKRREFDTTHKYWRKIFSGFLSDPSLTDMHKGIYGTTVPAKEHSMFSLMMQTVENLTEGSSLGIFDLSPSWKKSISKWVKHPSFPSFWAENKDDYTPATQSFVQKLHESITSG